MSHSDVNGQTVFHVAVVQGMAHTVERLCEHPSFNLSLLEQASYDGRAPLQELALKAYEEIDYRVYLTERYLKPSPIDTVTAYASVMRVFINQFDNLLSQSYAPDFYLVRYIVGLDYDTIEECLRKGMLITSPYKGDTFLLHCCVSESLYLSSKIILILAKHGLSPNEVDAGGRTLLHTLFDRKSWETDLPIVDLVKTLMTPMMAESRDKQGRTALHVFLTHKNDHEKYEEALKVLLTSGARLDTLDWENRNCFEILCRNSAYSLTQEEVSRKARIFAQLINHDNGAKVPKHSSALPVILRWAAKNNQVKLFDMILGTADQINGFILKGVLRRLVAMTFINKVLARIRQSDLFGSDKLTGRSLMHEICYYNYDVDGQIELKVLEKFLSLKPPLDDLCREYSMTPLMYAAYSRKLEHAKCLVQSGADVRYRDQTSGGWNALHYAISGFHLDTFKFLVAQFGECFQLHDLECSEYEVERGSSQILKRPNALHFAWRDDMVEFRDYILTAFPQVDVNSPDDYGITPITVSIAEGQMKAVEALIDRGAHINIRTHFGGSALHYAVSSGSVEMVQLVLKNGGKADQVDAYGRLPIDVAVMHGYREIENLLLQVSRSASGTTVVADTTKIMEFRVAVYHSLVRAIEIGEQDTVAAILTHNSIKHVDAPPCAGCKPLFIALEQVKPACAQVLFDHGASSPGVSCTRSAYSGFTAIQLAARDDRLVDVLKALLLRHALDVFDLKQGRNPIYIAVSLGNHAGLQALLRQY